MNAKSNLEWIGLQFFAEGEDQGSEGTPGGEAGAEPTGGSEGNGGSDKTFTQEDVNKLLAREKRKGKASLLRELGLDPEDKDAVEGLKTLLNNQRTDSEKKDKALKDAQNSAAKLTTRAEAAEQKLKVLLSGCNKDFVDEVTAMALAKVDEDTDFEQALEAVKKKMPACFGTESDTDTGTGRGQGHRKPKSESPGSFGASLAASITTPKESPYFKN